MTDERMALAELLEKGSDGDLLREMIGFVAQRLMDMDVDGLVGAGHGERIACDNERESGHPATGGTGLGLITGSNLTEEPNSPSAAFYTTSRDTT